MTSLREQFADAASRPAPPSRLSGDEVYRTAWRRRRIRNRLAAATGGCMAVVLAAVAVLITPGAPDHDTTPAAPSASPTTTVREVPYSPDDVMNAVATDRNHLYASRNDVLYGSDDGGRTWPERRRNFSSLNPLDVPAPGVISARFPDAFRFSTDGGRNWTDVKPSSGTMLAIPTGGWATCNDNNQGLYQCTMYGVDVQTGRQRKLTKQPPSIIPTHLNKVPATVGLWVSGYVPDAARTGVSVSHDNGRTWSTYVLGQNEAGYPQDINNQDVSIATIDGATAYAIVSVVTNNSQNWLLVYRTTDGGQTWQRADPGHTLPWLQHGDASFLTADGTHVVQTVVSNPAEWYGGTTGAYTKPAPMSGLEPDVYVKQPVKNETPGMYTLFDRSAVYTSPDGRNWTRHPVRVS